MLRIAFFFVENLVVDYNETPISFFSILFRKTDFSLGYDSESNIGLPNARLSDLINKHSICSYILNSDIEGAEARILSKDDQVLENCCQIIIELHDSQQEDMKITVSQLAEVIVSKGFHVTDHSGAVWVFNRE